MSITSLSNECLFYYVQGEWIWVKTKQIVFFFCTQIHSLSKNKTIIT